MKKGIISLVGISLLFVGCGGGGGSSSVNICEDKDTAYIESHEFIKIFLKSPSSAKFQEEPTDYTYKGDCRHWFLSYVDSQNSFGAMLRSNYTIGVRYDDNKSDWVLDEYPEFWK